MKRRQALCLCICCAVGPWPGLSSAERKRADISGCLIQPGDTRLLGLDRGDFGALPSPDQLIGTTGDPQVDRALGRALVRASETFRVNPGFAFFRDDGGPNAYASPETFAKGTRGSVIFGRQMFKDQFTRYKDNGMSVLAIVAHEFGHICQYARQLMADLRRGEPTIRRIELHADFLSGWYLGRRKLEDPNLSLWASGDTFNRIGDFAFNQEQHHGTPKQRVAAAERGFDLGFRGKADIDGAVEEGRRYIRTTILQ